MAERISHERGNLGTSASETQTRETRPETLLGDDVTGTSTPAVTTHSIEDPKANKNPVSVTEKGVESAHATLARSAVQEWFSTVLDALLSLAPLFFLSMLFLFGANGAG